MPHRTKIPITVKTTLFSLHHLNIFDSLPFFVIPLIAYTTIYGSKQKRTGFRENASEMLPCISSINIRWPPQKGQSSPVIEWKGQGNNI